MIPKGPARGSRALAIKLASAGLLVLVAVIAGRYFGHHLAGLEDWIANHGRRGEAVFVLALVLLTSVFVPDSLFAVAAGVLFGVARGTVLVSLGALLTAGLNFLIARRLAHRTVQHWLERVPRLAALEQVVQREGFKFQFLLRLTPLNPVTLNYLLGATNTRFTTYLLAALGMIPGLFVEVYFGHVAHRLARLSNDPQSHGTPRTLLTSVGLVLCLAVLIYVTLMARKAVTLQERKDLASAAGLPKTNPDSPRTGIP